MALDLDDALPRGVRHAVEIAADRDHALVTDAALDGEHGAAGHCGVRDQRRLLLGEMLDDDAIGGGVDAGVGDTGAPGLDLRLQVVEVAKAPGQEEVLPDVADGPLHLAFRLGPTGSAGARYRAVMIQERDQRGVVGDDALAALAGHRRLHPVIGQLGRRALHGGEGVDMAAEHGLQVLPGAEPAPEPAAVAEHHGEQPDLPDDAGFGIELHPELGEVDPARRPGGVSNRRSKGFGFAGRAVRRRSVTTLWQPSWPSSRISRGRRFPERSGQATTRSRRWASQGSSWRGRGARGP